MCILCVCLCLCTGGDELHSDCLAVVQAPKVQVDPQLTLPLDINNYLMTHYIRAIFKVNTHSHTKTNNQKITWVLHVKHMNRVILSELHSASLDAVLELCKQYVCVYVWRVCVHVRVRAYVVGTIVWNADSPAGEFSKSN